MQADPTDKTRARRSFRYRRTDVHCRAVHVPGGYVGVYTIPKLGVVAVSPDVLRDPSAVPHVHPSGALDDAQRAGKRMIESRAALHALKTAARAREASE